MTSTLRTSFLATAATVAMAAALITMGSSRASATTQICDKYGSTKVSSGHYVVQNNEWGADTRQCISVTDDGFSITAADHNNPTNGSPASYPSIYAGCHFGNCSADSGLPFQVGHFVAPRTSVDFTTSGDGQWDAAYDIWFDPNPNPSGHNTGAEMMIWADHRGNPQPAGSKVGTANIAGSSWEVWRGGIVVSYVRVSAVNSLSDLSIKDFTDDAEQRGYIDRDWYLTSVQFGFEPWQGGAGLTVNSFSFTP